MQTGEKTYAEQWKRQLAALLLMVFLSPSFAVFLLATTQNNEAMLPACCRSHGKHQCFKRGHDSQTSLIRNNLLVLQLTERCPFSQLAIGPHLSSGLGIPLWGANEFNSFQESNLVSHAIASKKATSSASTNLSRGPPVFSAYFPTT
jgi:hypothetical protein